MAGFTINGDLKNVEKALVAKFSNVESAQRENDVTPIPSGTAVRNTVVPDSTMVIQATPGMDWWLALAAMIGAVFVMVNRRR
jgi:hypothetical protein